MARIRLTIEDGIAELVLDRPEKLNAVDDAAMAELAAAGDRLLAADLRALLVRGEGRSFCVGADRDHLAPDGRLADLVDPAVAVSEAADRVVELQRQVVWLAELSCVTVAAVQGHALGLGLQLALLCDLRIAADDARFAVLETGWGVVPDAGGTWLLPRLVGSGRAAAMVLTGERVEAAEALRSGLVNRVVPAQDLTGAARDLVREWAARPRAAVAEAKGLLRGSFDRTLPHHLRAEAEAQVRALRAAGTG